MQALSASQEQSPSSARGQSPTSPIVAQGRESWWSACSSLTPANQTFSEPQQFYIGEPDIEAPAPSASARCCKRVVLPFFVGPLVIVAALVGIGWNEREYVCKNAMIDQARNFVKEVRGCGEEDVRVTEGGVALFSCGVDYDKLPGLSPGGPTFPMIKVYGTGLESQVEMLLCDQTAVGGTGNGVNYTTKKRWSSEFIDSSKFREHDPEGFERACGNVSNPPFPRDLRMANRQRVLAKELSLGAFVLRDPEMLASIPLTEPVKKPNFPKGWVEMAWDGVHGIGTTRFVPGEGIAQEKMLPFKGERIGEVRARFFSNDWRFKNVTVLGRNDGGEIRAWQSGKSWLCEAQHLAKVKLGLWTQEDFLEECQLRKDSELWLLRVAGLALLWAAFFAVLRPLGVAKDCLPCLGPAMGDMAHVMACSVAVLPAISCFFLVAGILWVTMRPVVGMPMLIACAVTSCVGFIMVICRQAQKARSKKLRTQGVIQQQQIEMPLVPVDSDTDVVPELPLAAVTPPNIQLAAPYFFVSPRGFPTEQQQLQQQQQQPQPPYEEQPLEEDQPLEQLPTALEISDPLQQTFAKPRLQPLPSGRPSARSYPGGATYPMPLYDVPKPTSGSPEGSQGNSPDQQQQLQQQSMDREVSSASERSVTRRPSNGMAAAAAAVPGMASRAAACPPEASCTPD